MNIKDVLTLCRWMISLGVEKIRFTGGEPLLFPNIVNVLEFSVSQGVETAITTNGFFLYKYINDIMRLRIKVNISLDTLDRKKFKKISGVNGFDRVWESINRFMDQDYPLKLNVVVMKGINDDEIINFVNLTRDWKIHVRFIEFMPFNGNRWGWNYCMKGSEILDIIRKHFPIEKLNDEPHSVARSYRVSGFAGTFAVITSVSEPFCHTCNRLRISSTGKLLYCLFDDVGIDLLPFIRTNDFERFKRTVGAYVRRKPLMRAGKELNPEITSFAMTELGG